jgi:hypothetical protein
MQRGASQPGLEMTSAQVLRCPYPKHTILRKTVMTTDRRPQPDDLVALKEIISGNVADP